GVAPATLANQAAEGSRSGLVGTTCAASGGDDPAGRVQSRQTETPGGEQGQPICPASVEGSGHHGDQAASACRRDPRDRVVTNPKISPLGARGYGDNVKHMLISPLAGGPSSVFNGRGRRAAADIRADP